MLTTVMLPLLQKWHTKLEMGSIMNLNMVVVLFAACCSNTVALLTVNVHFRRKTRYGDCNRGTAGFAYVGGACVVNKRLEKVIASIIAMCHVIILTLCCVVRSTVLP